MLKKIIEENDDLKEQFKKLNVELIEDLMEGKNEKEPIVRFIRVYVKTITPSE